MNEAVSEAQRSELAGAASAQMNVREARLQGRRAGSGGGGVPASSERDPASKDCLQ